jgi:hypothetical protein
MTKKITKKYNEGLRWPPFDILHATANQKQVGVMEGGWDRPRDRASMFRERDGNVEPLAEGNEDDNNKYDEDGNMLCNWKYFGTYLGYLPTMPTSPQCDTFQLIPVSF